MRPVPLALDGTSWVFQSSENFELAAEPVGEGDHSDRLLGLATPPTATSSVFFMTNAVYCHLLVWRVIASTI